MSIFELASNINEKVQRAKQNKDKAHHDVTQLFKVLPTYILGPLSTIASYISQNMGMSIGPLKVLTFFKFNF